MSDQPRRPNCYACVYRREIPGDAHSRCAHPALGELANETDPLSLIVSVIAGKAYTAAQQLHIQAEPHGIRRGWFMWPANFDPVWLRNCDGFTAKDPPT